MAQHVHAALLMLHKCFHPAHTRSFPCQVDVPLQDEMREAGHTEWPGLTHENICFTQAPTGSSSDYLKILWRFFWYERCNAERMSSPSFVCLEDDPAFLTEVRVECRNYWAICRPTNYEPITRSDQTLTPYFVHKDSLQSRRRHGELISPSPRYGT